MPRGCRMLGRRLHQVRACMGMRQASLRRAVWRSEFWHLRGELEKPLAIRAANCVRALPVCAITELAVLLAAFFRREHAGCHNC